LRLLPGPGGVSTRINVVDPGFMVDPVDWDTPDQPHNPDPPRYPERVVARPGVGVNPAGR